MFSETSLQRTFLAVGSLGRWEYFVHLSCFLLYLDMYLAIGGGVTIGDLNLDWIRANISLGDVLVVLVGYSFVRSFFLPLFDAVNTLFFVPFWGRRIKELPREEIDPFSWRAYTIITRNSPAYREIDWLREKNQRLGENSANCRHLCLLFLADFAVGRITGKSVVSGIITFASSLPNDRRLLILIPLFFFFTLLGLYALLSPMAMRVSVPINSEALLTDVKETLKLNADNAELSQSLDARVALRSGKEDLEEQQLE